MPSYRSDGAGRRNASGRATATAKVATPLGRSRPAAARESARLALVAVLLVCVTAQADEAGTPFWLSGSYFFSAAVPNAPGWYVPTQFYYYNGSSQRNKSFQRGDTLNLGLNANLQFVFITPTWNPDVQWLGGQPSFSLTLGGGRNSTSADISISTKNNNSETLDRNDVMWGGMDLYPQGQIAWTKGYSNWMTYITGDIPTGAYNSQRLANIGLGHGAIDAGGAYTYFNTKSGFETSAVLGFTYNMENSSTSVRSGVDSHLDFDVAQFLSDHLHVGVVGYVYYQLSGDSGSGNLVGPFKSRVASLGPEVGYLFTAAGAQWYINLRGYWEFWAQNRLEGHAVYLTVSIPLQAPKK
jgi:hypothetical protein